MKLQFKNWLIETGTVGGNAAQAIKPGSNNMNLNAVMTGFAKALGINNQSGKDADFAKLKQELPNLIKPAVEDAVRQATEKKEKEQEFRTNKPKPPGVNNPNMNQPLQAQAQGARGK